MFYIINSENKCIAICDTKPDLDDLKSRNEFSVESQEIYKIGYTYENKELKEPEKTDSEKLFELRSSVSSALSVCNSVGLQCYMTNTVFPADWVAYRAKLVALSATTECEDTLSLPTQPDLPSGVII